jgi:type II secretory pathway component PulF
LIVVVIGLAVYFRYRAAQENMLLAAIGVAAQRGLPLITAIEAYAGQSRRGIRRRAERLVEMLRAGHTLADAMELSRAVRSPESRMVVRIGSQTGTLAPALDELMAARESRESIWGPMTAKVTYLACLAFVFAMIATFMALKIAPAMVKIFADFKMELPELTRYSFAATNFLGQFFFLVVPVLLGLFGLMVYAVLRYIGLIGWDLPWIGTLARRLDTAAILDALGLVVRRGQPLAQGLAVLADWYPKPAVRDRLRRVATDVDGGADCWQSLCARGLLKKPDLAVLQAAGRAGNLAWALGEMADSNRRRLAYRAYVLLQVLFPVVILACGLAVMVFVTSYFLPLVVLIQSLT